MPMLPAVETLRSAAAQQAACSCSYPTPSLRSVLRTAQRWRGGGLPVAECAGRRPAPTGAHAGSAHRGRTSVLVAAAPDPVPISGYTPAHHIAFSDDVRHLAPHRVSATVNAPASLCFSIWNDWNRLVDFLDLVAQIGLDPNNPDLALFQCFYRYGIMPVMEIVFVLQKTEVVKDRRIAFESVWGMPLQGHVTFTPLPDGKTELELAFTHALPHILVELKVGVFGVQNSLGPMLAENLDVFASLAEAAARDPASLPPREEGVPEPGYGFFDQLGELEKLVAEVEAVQALDEQEQEDADSEDDAGAAGEGSTDGDDDAAPEASTAPAPAAPAAPVVKSTSKRRAIAAKGTAAQAGSSSSSAAAAAKGAAPAAGRGAKAKAGVEGGAAAPPAAGGGARRGRASSSSAEAPAPRAAAAGKKRSARGAS